MVLDNARTRSDATALARGRARRIVRRMPRMQVYLPDELYRLVKARRLPASELLQKAVRAEVHRQDLLAKGDRDGALREYQVRGIKTNISFHQWILRHPRFMAGNFSTGFIDEEYQTMSKAELYPHKEIALASAAIAAIHREHERTLGLLAKGAAEPSKWREQGKRSSLRVFQTFPGRGWRHS